MGMPVRWYWEKLQSETMGWTAAFYYSNMFVYLISVLEMIAWCMYITGDVWYLMWMAKSAMWASIGLYGIPVIFILMYMSFTIPQGGIAWTWYKPGYINGLFYLIVGTVWWLFHSLIHPSILHVEPAQAHLHE